MTLEMEDEFIGVEAHLVPQIDPGDKCNGKKTVTIHGESWEEDVEKKIDDVEVVEAIEEKNDVESFKGTAENRTYFKGYCQNYSGSGTDDDSGRCRFHGGATENAGAPAHNQNNAKTQMTADPHHYHESLPQVEQDWIDDTTTAILERVRRIHGRDPDFLDRTLARSIAINFHILSKARDYSKDELIQVIVHDGGDHEEKGALVEEVRRFQNSIIQNLKQLGVLEDPESQKADAMGEWRGFIDGGDDSDTVIDVSDES